MLLGLGLALVGGLVWLAGRVFPRLEDFPGTLRWQGGGVTCIVPILGSILLSVLLTLLLNLVARWLK